MANHPHDSKRPESAAVRRALETGDISALKTALSPRQRRFAEEYIFDYVGNKAAIRAGYAIKYADQQASLLLRHKGVAAYIDYLGQTKESKIVSINPDYIIQQVNDIITKEGARDGDKLRGLELLARHLGMFIDRTEITGKDGGAIEVEQRRIEEEAKTFTDLLKGLQARADSAKKDVSLI
jgi:phage terminase small subunit